MKEKVDCQNYALIKYLEENNLKLIIDGKLNPVFGKAEGFCSEANW